MLKSLSMKVSSMPSSNKTQSSSSSIEDENGLKRGTWTVEEDNLLIHSISLHGEGRWNLLALRSGLRRTGKSCRLRWLNYLKPDVKRGNLSSQEQLLILDLHSRWGNRWSKIAQELPGRTDNEIKNYWRTRVQKQAKLLNIDPNSPKFKDIIRYFWIPRLLQQINEPSSSSSSNSAQTQSGTQLSESDSLQTSSQIQNLEKRHRFENSNDYSQEHELNTDQYQQFISSCISPSESMDISDCYDMKYHLDTTNKTAAEDFGYLEADCHVELSDWMADDSDASCFWNFDNLWQF